MFHLFEKKLNYEIKLFRKTTLSGLSKKNFMIGEREKLNIKHRNITTLIYLMVIAAISLVVHQDVRYGSGDDEFV